MSKFNHVYVTDRDFQPRKDDDIFDPMTAIDDAMRSANSQTKRENYNRYAKKLHNVFVDQYGMILDPETGNWVKL